MFLHFFHVFSLFCDYLPLEKGAALHLNKLESLLPKDVFANFGLKWPSGSGTDENGKSLQTDGWTDDGKQAIREAHMNELKSQM